MGFFRRSLQLGRILAWATLAANLPLLSPVWAANETPQVSTAASTATAPALSEAQQADADAAAFLKKYAKIRIAMTYAPGNGHQAYAVTVMKRLRELGFQGQFEVFYNPGVKERLEYLLPGFKAKGAKNQTLPDGTVAVEWDDTAVRFAPSEVEHVELAIMGGDDHMVQARALDADTVIRVQPSGWGVPPSIETQGHEATWSALSHLPTSSRVPRVSDPAQFLREQMGASEKLRAKIPGLQALLENRGKTEILAAYGLSFSGEYKLARIIEALQQAMAKYPERFKGPVVIPFLSSFNKSEWKTFQGMLKKLNAQKALTIAKSTDSNIGRTVAGLKKNQILLMEVGSVPQDLWNVLVDASSLPPTIAGTSGNNFAKGRGKPFINTVYATDVTSKRDGSADRIFKAHDCLARTGSNDELVEYLADSLDPQSSVSKMFAEQAQAIKEKPDKVSAVLQRASAEIQAQKRIVELAKKKTGDLLAILYDSDAIVARAAMSELAKRKDPKVIERLIIDAMDADPRIAQSARENLRFLSYQADPMEGAAVRSLKELADGTDRELARLAINFLEKIRTPSAIKALSDLSIETTPEIAVLAIQALGKIATPEAGAELLRLSEYSADPELAKSWFTFLSDDNQKKAWKIAGKEPPPKAALETPASPKQSHSPGSHVPTAATPPPEKKRPSCLKNWLNTMLNVFR